MRLKYDIKLAKPGELSGDLIVVGSALEEAVNTGQQVIIHSVMARGDLIISREKPADEEIPWFDIGNLRASVKNNYRSKLIRQEYGNHDSRLVTPGFFFKDEGYEPADFFKGADIVYFHGDSRLLSWKTRKKPVLTSKVPLEDVDIEEGNYGIPCYMAKILDMYERDFRSGKLSKRLMKHVPSKFPFFYRRNTRKLERTRKKIKRNIRWGWATAGLEIKEADIKKGFR